MKYLNQIEKHIMKWFADNNRKAGEVMLIPQYNQLRNQTENYEEYLLFSQALASLIEQGYLKKDSRKNIALTLKGFNYINNK